MFCGLTSKLTPKQEAFCQAYIENGGNASEAYRSAYSAEAMKDEVVHVKASELLKNGKVTVRLASLQAQHAKRHEITVDSLVGELEEARLAAMQNPRGISAAVSAVMGKAKLLGLVTDKLEHTGKDGAPIAVIKREMTPQEAAELYARTVSGD